MLFNSAEFVLLFLPIAAIGFYAILRWSQDAAVYWLLGASLLFYASWHPPFLIILSISIVLNFAIAGLIGRADRLKRTCLVVGVAANLGALFYFKYINFAIDNLSHVVGADFSRHEVLLPIGISFFTFQQIAFLVDCYRDGPEQRSFVRYALFVTFFPHLIAGPMVHHREMMPQFGTRRPDPWSDVAEGLTLFIIGLVKKMVIADTVARSSTLVFDSAALGGNPTMFEAWTAALCYTLQIYFDFSAYSDMAVGLGRMFGINLPINFASPYKARSIIDFWRRWHISLSRFLRDYLYIPLGGSRRGAGRQRINLVVTMLLGGFWHGASWTFVLWGSLHGLFLLINHLWRDLTEGAGHPTLLGTVAARTLTMVCVVFAWVPFQAADLNATFAVWRGMLGMNGVILPQRIAQVLPDLGLEAGPLMGVSIGMIVFVALAFGIALFAPNAYEIMRNANLGTATKGYPATFIATNPPGIWRRRPSFAMLTAAALTVAIMKLNDISEFIYFRF